MTRLAAKESAARGNNNNNNDYTYMHTHSLADCKTVRIENTNTSSLQQAYHHLTAKHQEEWQFHRPVAVCESRKQSESLYATNRYR